MSKYAKKKKQITQLLQAQHRSIAVTLRQKVVTEMSNSRNQKENIAPPVFSLRTLQKKITKDMRIKKKVAQKKVQVRGKLAEIVSIFPTGFARFKCGTRLAGRSEMLVNYSQRDPHSK